MGDAEEGGGGGPGTKAIRKDMKSLLHPRTVLLVEDERQQEDILFLLQRMPPSPPRPSNPCRRPSNGIEATPI